jgi:hypothetical protein
MRLCLLEQLGVEGGLKEVRPTIAGPRTALSALTSSCITARSGTTLMRRPPCSIPTLEVTSPSPADPVNSCPHQT